MSTMHHADFLTTTAGQTYIANLTVGQNLPGAAGGLLRQRCGPA